MALSSGTISGNILTAVSNYLELEAKLLDWNVNGLQIKLENVLILH